MKTDTVLLFTYGIQNFIYLNNFINRKYHDGSASLYEYDILIFWWYGQKIMKIFDWRISHEKREFCHSDSDFKRHAEHSVNWIFYSRATYELYLVHCSSIIKLYITHLLWLFFFITSFGFCCCCWISILFCCAR